MAKILLQVGAPPEGEFTVLGNAVNAGSAGVGVVASPSKVGLNLQFKAIDAGSSKVTVTDDPANKTVDIDISEAAIAHQNLSGAGTNTHAVIDAQLPTADQKAALAGSAGTPGAGNRYVTSGDARLPSQPENDALVGTSGTPSGANPFVTDSDSRLTDSRSPSGAAGGQLGGTFPNPDVRGVRETSGPTLLDIGSIADGEFLRRSGATIIGDAITTSDDIANAGTGGQSLIPSPSKIGTDYQVKSIAGTARLSVTDNVGNKRLDIDVVEGAISHQNLSGAGTLTHAQLDAQSPSSGEKLALAGTSGTPGAANRYVTSSDARLPTTTQTDALAGTAGTPSSSNLFVTDEDIRNTNARTPTGAASGQLGGTYPAPDVRGLRETSGPTLLTIGSVANGQVLRRSGSTLIGDTLAFATAVGLDANSFNSSGSGTEYARANHVHAVSSAGTLTSISAGDTSNDGIAVGFSRKDHRHAVPTAAPQPISSTTTSEGVGGSLARADHVHPHGNLAGGTLHDAATGALAGFMSAADKSKLDGIDAGAEVTSFAKVAAALAAATSDIAVNARKITGVAAGTADTDAVNRLQLNTVAAGIQVKEAVRVASTSSVANLSSVPVQPFQGQINLNAGDRVLIKDSASADGVEAADPKRNGVYVVGTPSGGNAAFTRAADCDTDSEVKPGMTVFCSEGTNADTNFTLTTDAPIVLDTTALIFTTFSTLAQLVAGDGISKTGNTLDLDLHPDGSLAIVGGQARVGALATDAQHGNRGGGALHAAATVSVAGFMSSADKTKLDGIETGATADQTITAGAGLTGGGTGDVALAVNFGTSAGQVAAGNDARIPTQDENDALVGTNGTASAANRYVTDSDPRNTNSRSPSGAASGDLGGTYPSPSVAALTTTTGPTSLTIGAIADGQVLARSGTSIVGASAAVLSSALPSNVDASAASAGVGGTSARFDHKHSIATAVPSGSVQIGVSAAEGTSSSLARADHVHAVPSPATVPTDVQKTAAAFGASNTFARADHIHGVSTAAPVSVGTSNQEGTATSLARSDHAHAIANDAVTTSTIVNAAVTLAKIQNAAANAKLLGSGSAGLGSSYSEISLGSGLQMTGTTLAATGAAAGASTQVQYNDGGALSGSANMIFDSATGTFTADKIVATSQLTMPSNTVTSANIQNAAVTYAKIQNTTSASVLIGRGSAAGAGVVQELTPANGIQVSGTNLQLADAGIAAAKLQDNAVTLPKLQNAVASSRLLGSGSAGAGANYAELTLGNGLAISGTALAAQTAAPSTLTIGASNTEGVATTLARADHIHSLGTPAAPANVTKAAASAGTASEPARADHKHDITTAAPISASSGVANAEGTATSLARSDHQHQVIITSSAAVATATTSTTSVTDVLLTGMTLTPGAGNWFVSFSGSFDNAGAGLQTIISLYVNGVQVADTERRIDSLGGGRAAGLSLSSIVTGLGDGQTIEIRWRVSGSTGNAFQRSLNLLKIG